MRKPLSWPAQPEKLSAELKAKSAIGALGLVSLIGK